MKKYIKHFWVSGDGVKDLDKNINRALKNRKATAKDVISISRYNSGSYTRHEVWYRTRKAK